MRRTDINVHIERVVLDGVSLVPGQEQQVTEALQAELGRLLAEGEVSPSLLASGALPYVSGDSLDLGSGGDPDDLGREIARALHGGLKR